MGDLIDYYGTECPHCKTMDPLVKQLEKELKIKVEKKEVWHNAKNQQELLKVNPGGGVPFFYNKKSGKSILGAVPYNTFKAWAQGK